jgi:hypothetical protein
MPIVREYHWPEQVERPAPFSIVTTDGTVYYATLAWTEGGKLHFKSTEGGTRELQLSLISKALTEAENARKNLHLPLP